MELIKNSPKDCYPVVQNTTVLMLKKLEQLLNMEATTTSSSDKVAASTCVPWIFAIDLVFLFRIN